MDDFLQEIRTHFNIIHKNDSLSLTLINPNLSLDIIKQIKNRFRLMHHIKKMEIIIIESVNFDDELLTVLAEALPQSLIELSLDFTGCQSLRGSGFLELFERISNMPLQKLKLDCSQVYDINDLVIEGLSMLLESLIDLEQLYLDFYEIDQISEDGYLILAECITHIEKLKVFHIDLSANPNLTEDSLQMLFSNLSANLIKFQFKILDVDHIGGGSFFKLGEKLAQMKNLKSLLISISSFSNLNQKGIYSILKAISSLNVLEQLDLNLSNINLAEKMLSYLNISDNLRRISLDVSCNRLVTDLDVINLAHKLKRIEKSSFNFDFCDKVTEDSLQEVSNVLFSNEKCLSIQFKDRTYSKDFASFLVEKVLSCKNLINLTIECGQQASKVIKTLNSYLKLRIHNLKVIERCTSRKMNHSQIQHILALINQ